MKKQSFTMLVRSAAFGMLFFSFVACKKTAQDLVPEKLISDFVIDGTQTDFTAPCTLTFINKSIGAARCVWVVNDTILLENPTYDFKTNGTYNVKCIAIDKNGRQITANKVIDIKAPQKPVTFAEFTIQPLQGNFYGIECTDACTGEGNAKEYIWDFGDGIVLTYNASGFVRHTYNAPGDYKVTLTVKDKNGACTKQTHDITIPPFNVGIKALSITKLPLTTRADGTTIVKDIQVKASLFAQTTENAPLVLLKEGSVQYIQNVPLGSNMNILYTGFLGTLYAPTTYKYMSVRIKVYYDNNPANLIFEDTFPIESFFNDTEDLYYEGMLFSDDRKSAFKLNFTYR